MPAKGVHRRAVFAGGVALAAAGCVPGDDNGPPTAFAGLLDDLAREALSASPELATALGALAPEADHAALDERGPLAAELDRLAVGRRLARLAGIERARLADPQDRATHAALETHWRHAAAGAAFDFGRFDVLGRFSPYVLEPYTAAFVALPHFLAIRHPAGSARDLETFVARLAQGPSRLDQEIERARADAARGIAAPDFVLARTALAAADPGRLAALRAALHARAKAVSDVPEAWRARAHAEGERLIDGPWRAAMQRTAEALARAAAAAPPGLGVGRLPRGGAYLTACLSARLGADAPDPGEAHAAMLAAARETADRLDMAMRAAGRTQGTVGQRLAQMRAEPAQAWALTDPAGPVAAMGRALDRLRQTLPRWITIDGAPAISPVAAPDSPGAAWLERPAFPPAGAPSPTLIAPLDAPRLAIVTRAAREGLPGRVLQQMRAAGAQVPLARRLLPADAWREGWAAYAEDLADDSGVYDGDGTSRIGYLAARLHREALGAMDLGVHALGWDRAQALRFVIETAGSSVAEADGALERCAIFPGAAYAASAGRAAIADMREKSRARLGADFDIRAFHDALLDAGPLPLAVADAAFQRWRAGS